MSMEKIKRENSPSYTLWGQEQQSLEEFQAAEELRISKEQENLYQEREKLAQLQWQELQVKLRVARAERAKQNLKIKEEWEAEQKRLKALLEERQRQEEEKRLNQERLQEQIEEFVTSNGDMPGELNEMLETNPGKPPCPFFSKTAACRFGDMCSRNHIRPTISRVLLIKNFYSHYSLDTKDNEHGDSSLEFESKETYEHFRDFFNDVVPEMEKLGHVWQFKTCCNKEAHLRGNVYIEYASCREAIRSYRVFLGRFYAGRQLNVEFCTIDSWKSAICGLFFRKRCPKGSVCNFLHVFRNPGGLFAKADRDLHRTPSDNQYVNQRSFDETSHSDGKNWRWSQSPERESYWERTSEEKENKNKTGDRLEERSHKRSRSRSFSRDSSRSSRRTNRNRSRSQSRSTSSRKNRSKHSQSRTPSQKSDRKSRSSRK